MLSISSINLSIRTLVCREYTFSKPWATLLAFVRSVARTTVAVHIVGRHDCNVASSIDLGVLGNDIRDCVGFKLSLERLVLH